jgi:hypothetical protein
MVVNDEGGFTTIVEIGFDKLIVLLTVGNCRYDAFIYFLMDEVTRIEDVDGYIQELEYEMVDFNKSDYLLQIEVTGYLYFECRLCNNVDTDGDTLSQCSGCFKRYCASGKDHCYGRHECEKDKIYYLVNRS